MSKKILVVGAGLAQVDAIKRAVDLGYHVVASDGSPNAEGLRIAHDARIIDVKDVEGNLSWAHDEKINGVISYASDITLPTVLSLCESFGLPGLGRTPMEISLDKGRQRGIFRKIGLSQPEFEIAETLGELNRASEAIGFPVVVKPVDNSGSRGVSFVQDREALIPAFKSAKENSTNGLIVVEKFEEGLELTIEGFSVGGTHHILAISDKFKPKNTPCVATQLAYPAAISEKQEREVIDLICSAYDAVGVDNAPTHSEVLVTENGPKLIEIGCRGGGFYVFTRLVEAVSGYDIVGNWTRLCAGDPVEEVVVKKKGAVLRFMIASPGRVNAVHGLEESNRIDGVQAGSFYSTGEHLPEFRNDGTRSGWMITTGKDRSEALKKADLVSRTVWFDTVVPG